MTTISGPAPRRDPKSGAKMVRPWRPMSPKAPYDRPGFLNSTLHNPNWISRHIFPPTCAIVTGASRMVASVLGFESSSSSSSSSSECDDSHDNNDDQDVSSLGVHTIEDREPQSFAGKNETKRLIEQLLMQESFSRQECDKLTDIIKSRVVGSPLICGLGLGRLNETPEITDVEIHDFCNTAVLEATKLLEGKSGTNSKSEMHHETSALNSVMLKHDVEGELGSPVDMAKSYMQTRPPWASPSKNNTEFRSPSPAALPLFKEETPYSIQGNFLYSSKRKRDSPATGSWNILDEIRKVRFKATEEMLRTLSSSKIDGSSFPLEHKNCPDSILANNLVSAKEYKSQGTKRPVDASIDLAAKPVSQLKQDAFHNDALPGSDTLGCEQNQVMQAIQSIEGKIDETLDVGQRLQSTVDMKAAAHSDVAPDANHLKESNRSVPPFSSTREGTFQDSQVEDKNCWTLNEIAGIGSANRFPSGSNMSSEVDKGQNHRPIISKEDKAIGCGHDNAVRVAAEGKCELLCEASIEVPVVNETDVAASGSQHSWSMQYEGSPQHQNTPISKGSLADKSYCGIEKQQQQGKEVSRYNRRGRRRHR